MFWLDFILQHLSLISFIINSVINIVWILLLVLF